MKGMGARENLYSVPARLLQQLFQDLPVTVEVCHYVSTLLDREGSDECDDPSGESDDLDESECAPELDEPIALAGARCDAPTAQEGGWESDASGISD